MQNKNRLKTLGPTEIRLISSLYQQNKTIFKIKDVKSALNIDEKIAGNIVSRLNPKGILTRIKQGLYSIVPFEFGNEKTFVPNVFLTAREIMAEQEYYLAYASALAIHEMTTQPQMTAYICVQKTKRPQNISGNSFKFVCTKKDFFFGIDDHWISNQERIKVSDGEKTIIDCLNHPQYCGGITEAARALYMKRDIINADKIVNYALRMNKGSICSRLGYLMELFEITEEKTRSKLKEHLNSSYVLLDPMLPKKDGKYNNDWMMYLNITREELKNIGRT